MSSLAWVPPAARSERPPAGGEADLHARVARIHKKGLIVLANEPVDAVAFDSTLTLNMTNTLGRTASARPAQAARSVRGRPSSAQPVPCRSVYKSASVPGFEKLKVAARARALRTQALPLALPAPPPSRCGGSHRTGWVVERAGR
eukprot:6361656-Prymnesium_polylepis.1